MLRDDSFILEATRGVCSAVLQSDLSTSKPERSVSLRLAARRAPRSLAMDAWCSNLKYPPEVLGRELRQAVRQRGLPEREPRQAVERLEGRQQGVPEREPRQAVERLLARQWRGSPSCKRSWRSHA